jgi:shikimate kinase
VNRTGKSIVLIGMMGAGKSSVGRLLQRRTGLARFDTDEAVAKQFDLSIPEIFSQFSEEKFRDAETEVLREFTADKSAIIVTGGGIVLREENVDLLKQLGTIVWLDADEEKLFERASRRGQRPLLQRQSPRKMFLELLRARQPLYAKAADLQVDTSVLTHDEVADMILNKIEELTAPIK